MTDHVLADQAQRQAALDPQRSFIVQAPAGSGKTGLLTQRFLRLLAGVENPEEIVAITFTRKAAAEMRQRVLQALSGAGAEEPESDFERQTWRLARAALEHAQSCNWELLENPQRLRIRTIDSLCQYIARQMPLESGFGEPPLAVEDASALYREAARSALTELESNSPAAPALAALLRVLDNRMDRLLDLVAKMLGRRDQWLRHLFGRHPRERMEAVLCHVVERHLRLLAEDVTAEMALVLPDIARFAASNVDSSHALAACRGMGSLPGADAASLPAWRGLAELLQTKSGTWRKQINVTIGFPAGDPVADGYKVALKEVLAGLQEAHGLQVLLRDLAKLPEATYSDDEWALLQALFSVLRTAVIHLRVVFSERGCADFCETALAAQAALGEEESPSELALRLDYRIHHLLVDEFQDTSQNQHNLFCQLTAGWQAGDGRSLFLVGDPMQSIYGFREAEVGLFLDAWQGRLGQLPLVPLRLSVNFRSQKGIIDWVNEQFPRILPPRDDKETGAVSYAPSESFHPGGGPAVQVYPAIERDDEDEARRILEIVHQEKARDPDAKTAVLVRGKAHLAEIVDAFRRARIRFQAVEIGELKHRPAVMDLMSLTLALLHPADHVSWLALLRSPLCGLGLADLQALRGDDSSNMYRTVAGLLHDDDSIARLSADGRDRTRELMTVLDRTIREQGRRPLRDRVESAWLALGGPLGLAEDAAAEDAEVFFSMLQSHEENGEPLSPELLRESVERLYSRPDPLAGESLQVMTIHKAKGLEFDTVILPGLGKKPRSEDSKMLYWVETTGEDGKPELFFGPLRPAGSKDHAPTSDYIRNLEAEMRQLESGRLLYVAATRARQRLHLFGHAKLNQKGEVAADSQSLLARLWPALGGSWEALADSATPGAKGEPGSQHVQKLARREARLLRIPAGWSCPQPPANAAPSAPAAVSHEEGIPFEWAGDAARAVGTVVHRLLQHLVETGSQAAELGKPVITDLLLRQGVRQRDLEWTGRQVSKALLRASTEERGRWVLSSGHEDSRCEVPVSAMIDGQLRHLVIDRTFIDEEGTRWIIDYKTGTHGGGDVEGFLDEEQQRYGQQLEHYAAAFRKLEKRKIRTALYYPLVPGGWRELNSSE